MYDACIIGYSKGLGKEISRLYSNPLGLGIEENCDITDPIQRQRIVDLTKNIDIVYIVPSSNSNRFAQIDMLCDLWDAYKDYNKKIVVISGSSPQTRTQSNECTKQKRYDASKHALDKTALNLSLMEKNCQVINIKPGRFNSDKYKDNKTKHLIDKTKLAQAIVNLVEASTYMRIVSTTIVSCPINGINGTAHD